MPKSRQSFQAEHAAFQKRLQAIHAGPVGIAARDAMTALRVAYRTAALEHWKELGNRASTGWGQPPEADFRAPQSVEHSAFFVTLALAQHFANDPDNPPGSER